MTMPAPRTGKSVRSVPLGTRLTAVAVAAAYALTQVVGAHAAEANFWAERKARGWKGPSPASGPAQGGGPSAPADALLAQLPSLQQNLVVSTLAGEPRAALPSGLSSPGTGAPAPAGLPRALTEWFGAVPLKYADVQDLFLPASWKPDDPFVVCLQDAHGNLEAQRNIAGVIDALVQAEGSRRGREAPVLVGMEGARGEFNFEPYRAFPDKAAVKKAAAA